MCREGREQKRAILFPMQLSAKFYSIRVYIYNFLFRQTINSPFINFVSKNKLLSLKRSFFKLHIRRNRFGIPIFFVKDMGLEFPTNLLISSKSSSKTILAKTEETISEFVFSSKIVSFSFLEIVQAVLVEVPQF